MQAGGNITVTKDDGSQAAALNRKSTNGTLPALDALRFYTEFANPAKSTYSWNKAQESARKAFTSGDLAMYAGYASELPIILKQNPNLNFDVARLPQLSGGATQRISTIAKVYALAIPRVAKNPQGAGMVLTALTSKSASTVLSDNIGLPSPRRDLLAVEPEDPLETIFRNSAIMAQSWRDPNPEDTYKIIAKMVESVVSGAQKMSQAIERANRELQVLLKK